MTNNTKLDYVINVLTIQNKSKLLTSGPTKPGTEVRCLRVSGSTGYYVPCVAYVRKVTPSGRITVDLWADKSETVTVSRKAILWMPESEAA